VDVFVANAGIAFEGGPELPDDDWDRMWRVNALAHVRAARLLLPEWLDRGSGHLVAVASAAGLLSSHGSAPYAVTKHAAVAFAEWMSITYGARGVGVTCVCPQGVRTRMLETAGVLGDLLRPEAIEPDVVAAETVDAVREGRFLVLPHPEVARYEQARAADRERWLAGMRKIQASIDTGDVEMRDPRSS
jgi:NAD(P)-dependent dehydrogenase (short-subunit alcohol dehydrogenase family)